MFFQYFLINYLIQILYLSELEFCFFFSLINLSEPEIKPFKVPFELNEILFKSYELNGCSFENFVNLKSKSDLKLFDKELLNGVSVLINVFSILH